MTAPERAVTVRALWPLLVVQNLESTVGFYRDALGFNLVGQADSDGTMFWCRLGRGASSIMLQQAEDEDGSAAGRGRGVEIDQPSVADYGMKQLFVPEPNGHSICFESPTEQKAG